MPNCFPKWLHHFTFPSVIYEGSNFFTFLPTLVIVCLFDYNHLRGYKMQLPGFRVICYTAMLTRTYDLIKKKKLNKKSEDMGSSIIFITCNLTIWQVLWAWFFSFIWWSYFFQFSLYFSIFFFFIPLKSTYLDVYQNLNKLCKGYFSVSARWTWINFIF